MSGEYDIYSQIQSKIQESSESSEEVKCRKQKEFDIEKINIYEELEFEGFFEDLEFEIERYAGNKRYFNLCLNTKRYTN